MHRKQLNIPAQRKMLRIGNLRYPLSVVALGIVKAEALRHSFRFQEERFEMNTNRKVLLIDADDTLWENNIYFERAISSVQEILAGFAVDPQDFRAALNQAESEHIVTYGYGTVNFTRSLVSTFAKFLPPQADPGLEERVQELGLEIKHHPIELLDGVPETLGYLSERHTLYLVTKGDQEEQFHKIVSSELRPFFTGVEILAEKNAAAFRGLMEAHSWATDSTWMIGNSPRSDINPALSAGMSAVYIPHPHTWVLEHEEPVRHPRLLELNKFSDLRRFF
jgi:putative hydrolase of the HAD superfamily